MSVRALIKVLILAIQLPWVAAFSPSAMAEACLAYPVDISPNMVTSVFGKERDLPQYNGVPHKHWGVDFQARNPTDMGKGADLVSATDGTVVGAGFWGGGYGNRVAIKRDNGDILIYSHMAKIDPQYLGGTAVGFKPDGGPAVEDVPVKAGDVLGLAGGTANHPDVNEHAIHLHLEYVTGFSGTKLRETNDGTNATRSRYMRNVLDYMCQVPPFAPGAGTSAKYVPTNTADPQAAEAAAVEPKITDKERYGIPDAPPYESYGGMSESQIIETEMLRRSLDSHWEERLTGLGKRGLWLEISHIDGVMLWLDDKIAEKRSRIEAMMSMLVAQRANQFFVPRLRSAHAQAERMSSASVVRN